MFGRNVYQSDYARRLDEKTQQYNMLVNRAEEVRRDCLNRRSKEEANLYVKAASVCAEIMGMSRGEPSIYSKWEQRKFSCAEEARQIVELLQPAVPPQPEEKKAPQEAETTVARAADEKRAAAPQEHTADENPETAEFTTRNATDDVPAKMIQQWYKEKPTNTFDEIVGMDEVRKQLEGKIELNRYDQTRSCLKLEPMTSFVFYGPPGTGKTSVIKAFVHEVMEEESFKYLHLEGNDIKDKLVGVAEKRVSIAFKEAIDNAPSILFIDELDNLCADRGKQGVANHQKSLTVSFMEAYNRLQDSGKQVMFLGATNNPEDLDAAVLDRVNLVSVPLPKKEVRENYFARKFQNIHLAEDLTIDQMAEETDGFSFRDLDRLRAALMTELGHQAIQENRQLDENNVEDREATDIASKKAIETGAIVLTRALFEEERKRISFKVNLQAGNK